MPQRPILFSISVTNLKLLNNAPVKDEEECKPPGFFPFSLRHSGTN